MDGNAGQYGEREGGRGNVPRPTARLSRHPYRLVDEISRNGCAQTSIIVIGCSEKTPG
jgi:hypothetical protein